MSRFGSGSATLSRYLCAGRHGGAGGEGCGGAGGGESSSPPLQAAAADKYGHPLLSPTRVLQTEVGEIPLGSQGGVDTHIPSTRAHGFDLFCSSFQWIQN